jgi:hypothetical protein
VGQVVEGTGGQRSAVGAGELETTNAMLRLTVRGRDEGGTVVGARVPGPTAPPTAPEGRPA